MYEKLPFFKTSKCIITLFVYIDIMIYYLIQTKYIYYSDLLDTC